MSWSIIKEKSRREQKFAAMAPNSNLKSIFFQPKHSELVYEINCSSAA